MIFGKDYLNYRVCDLVTGGYIKRASTTFTVQSLSCPFSIFGSKGCAFYILNAFVICAMAKPAEILVFGGNGFIGSECVLTLLKEGHGITVLNRGNNYWDYSTAIKPHVNEFRCDRHKGLASCSFDSEDPKNYDFVIDFSAFKPDVIEDALVHLKGRIGTYIYISSDSVYEVSKVSGKKCSREEDAVRPEDPNEQQELNRRDRYGHNKLAGEEVLEKDSTSGIPYVIFRLPDVIGPKDRTNRWWAYQTWMQVYGSSGKPLMLPRGAANLATSYVYVKDVARIISKTVTDILNGNKAAHFGKYNIAFPGEYSAKTVLDSIQRALGVKGVEYRYDDKAYHLYPSVTRGPVDISKATEVLQWTATPWHEAVQETIDFFKDAFLKYKDERLSMVMDLANLVDEDFDTVKKKVKRYLKLQGASSQESELKAERHDEL